MDSQDLEGRQAPRHEQKVRDKGFRKGERLQTISLESSELVNSGGQDSGRSTTTDVRGGIQINQKAMRSFIRTHNGGEPLFFEQCQRGLNAV